MEITLPLFPIRHQRIGGTESSIYNLAKGLHRIGTRLKLARSRRDFLAPEFLAWLDGTNIEQSVYRSWGKRIAGRFLEETWFDLFDRSKTVLYPNYFLPPMRRHRAHRAVIIHDVQCKTYPQYFTYRKRIWFEANIARTLAHADALLFISQFERQQTARFFGDAFLDRSHVIYTAIDWDRYGSGIVSEGVQRLAARPFILTVAHQFPHKNLETLIGAFAVLGARHPDLSLVMVGKPSLPIRAAADALLTPNTSSRVHFTGFVSDADLGHLYRNMQLFALPSRYEGFGMPAVEAMAFGKPTLLADGGALREVTLDKAAYLPLDATAGDWSDALDGLLGKPGLGAADVADLKARYSPEAAARLVTHALGEPPPAE
ncbi:MAG TPA: glycosyltransferase family 1 protein [Allosphingosinicella sp.]|nr:glycosyltransferase family 1 protein [Allosphingosinicella sp.]